MALIDKASLLMVPSTYEDGTLYNVLPSGNKAPDETGNHNGYDQTRADFTFSRGFNLAATRVNANGLIEKGRENLLLQSNQFDTTWVNANSSETGGQADKDGGTDAWKIDISGAGGRIYQSVSQSGVSTYSIYAKAGSLNWIILSSNIVDASFDLLNGVKGTLVGGISSSIESVGGGWYRCSASLNGSLTQVRIYPSNADNDFTSTSGSIYIQSAQLEVGLVATPYIETGATTATAGVLENTPRIDYSSGAGSLLLEPQRTNLLPHSEYFGAWSTIQCTLTHNYGISPDGTKNSTRCVFPSSNRALEYLVSSSAAIASIYIKGINGETIQFGTNGAEQTFTLNGEWQRIEKYNAGSFVRVTLNTYAGTARDFEIWGAQLESSASYPSSYVPTYGSAATRGADSCSVTGASDVIGQTEGTLYWELEKIVNGFDYYQVSDGGTNNWILVGIDSGNVLAYIKTGGAVQVSTGSPMSVGRHKIALAYAANDVVLYLDGVQVGSDTSVSIPATNEIALSQGNPAGAKSISTNTFQCALFNERLSNTELATLTTL